MIRIWPPRNLGSGSGAWYGRTMRLAVASLALPLLSGCEPAVLNARGAIGVANRAILLDSLAIMLVIVVPTIALVVAFSSWFRASNTRARYRPDFVYSGQIELVTWAIPLLTIMLLGGVAWIGAHELDPAETIKSDNPPLEVQVVAMDWKWLFIYPAQHIATVNQLVLPVGIPVHFSMTSSSVLNAFFIPRLGSMIYVMNGMTTNLNLIANTPGIYRGLSAHYSGDGFSDMHFTVRAVSAAEFGAWMHQAASAGPALSSERYADLVKQSINVSPLTFNSPDPNLFWKIVTLKLPPGPGPGSSQAHPVAQPAAEHSHAR